MEGRLDLTLTWLGTNIKVLFPTQKVRPSVAQAPPRPNLLVPELGLRATYLRFKLQSYALEPDREPGEFSVLNILFLPLLQPDNYH